MSSTLRPDLPAAPPAPERTEHVLAAPETRRAALLDLVHSWALDLSPFAPIIAAHLNGKPSATVIELGCGTGELAMQLLRGNPTCAYYGFDDSSAMAQLFGAKARTLATPANVHLTAPIDLTRKPATAMLQRCPRADAVLMVRFLQIIPPIVAAGDLFSRADLIHEARRLSRPGAKLFIVEDVFGESPDAHRAAQAAWDEVIMAALNARADLLLRLLPPIDPELGARVAQGDRASILRGVRAALDRGFERQPLPLSAWSFLLHRLGFKHQSYVHPALAHLCLFAIDL